MDWWMCIWKAVADYRWSIYLLLVLESRWRSSVAGGGVGDHVHGSFHPFFRSSHRTKLYIAKKGSDFDEPRYQVRSIDRSKQSKDTHIISAIVDESNLNKY